MTEIPAVVRSHFWVTSHPFCEAVLFLCPQNSADSPSPHAMVRLYDSDGEVVNEVEVTLRLRTPVALELDPLMESCKLESGFRHAHLMVEHGDSVRPVCRLQNRGGAVMSGCSHPVTQAHTMFSPVTLAPDQSSLITLVNYGAAEAQVRVRLMLLNRNPDIVQTVPPFGSRVICLEREFMEVLTTGFGKSNARAGGEVNAEKTVPPEFARTRGYVRLSVRNEQSVGAQLIESIDRGEQGTIFTALSW